MLFALAPAWVPYSNRMWSSGHYQYFPVLLALVAYLIYSRRESLQSQATQPTAWVSAIGLVSVALLALAAHLLYSGFVGIVATVLACWVVVYAIFGSGGLRSVGTVLSLLVFAVPLPLSLDQSLIVKMQFWASQIAAQLLDGLGIMHFRQGVILVTEKSQFMTEEACSGIRSLFSSLTFVCVLSVMQHHHWARAIFNLLQTIIWVILGNAVRVAAVVILADYVSPWFATGAGHEILGMAVFLFILMMVVSTDALVSMVLFRPLVVGHELLSQSIVPVKREEIELSFARGSDSEPPASVANPSGVRSKSQFAWTGAFVWVGLVGCWVAVVHTGILNSGLSAMPDMPPPAEEDLPIVLGDGWQRTKFEHVQSGRESDIGPRILCLYLQSKRTRLCSICRSAMGRMAQLGCLLPSARLGIRI